MNCLTCRVSPRDLLFFRDGRPLDIDKRHDDHRNIGHGAYWPRPDHFYNAVMHALIGARMAGEKDAYGAFGGLQVEGPFPLLMDPDLGMEKMFFPRPLDWDCLLKVLPRGATDAPKYVHHGFIDREDGKKVYPSWISYEDYLAYLSATTLKGHVLEKIELFGAETRIGNTLDFQTCASKRFSGDAHRSGQYEAQYLRLSTGVSMWASVNTGRGGVSVPPTCIMGGQGGLVDIERDESLGSLNDRFPIKDVEAKILPADDGMFYVRWTLLVPALFSQTGWRPGWVDENIGKVRLKREPLVRFDGESREDYKARQAAIPDIEGVYLDAAHVGKPIVISGYDNVCGVKDTQLAVPSGSCYVFRCETVEAAGALVRHLHLTRKSDFGSQGFGIGVCSIVKPDLS